MKKLTILAIGAAMAAVLPGLAAAATAYSTANVNMRSGPSTRYPAVIIVPAGARVNIQGCMQTANWCDVAYAGYRGWVSGSYLQTTYSQRRVYVGPEYYRPLGIPMVTFSIGSYWDRHYRDRDFYRDRDDWRDGSYRPRPPRYDNNNDDTWRRPPPNRDWNDADRDRNIVPQRVLRPDPGPNVRPTRQNHDNDKGRPVQRDNRRWICNVPGADCPPEVR